MEHHVELITLRHVIKHHTISRNHKQLHHSQHLIQGVLIFDHRLSTASFVRSFALSMCQLVILLLGRILLHKVEVNKILLHDFDIPVCLQMLMLQYRYNCFRGAVHWRLLVILLYYLLESSERSSCVVELACCREELAFQCAGVGVGVWEEGLSSVVS